MQALGYEAVGPSFSDSQQGVSGIFLEGSGPRIELLAPLGSARTLEPWLRGGSRMYHFGYEVPELRPVAALAEACGARIVSEPKPAIAFGNREVCFLMLRNLFLFELIESESDASG